MTTAVIIEDEKDGQLYLQSLLTKLCPEITVLGLADNIESGYKLLLKTQPQLVFLDIQMPGGNGFDLLERFPQHPFKVIFITAHESYAFRAIKFSALDYLLKPIDPLELVLAVNKAESVASQIEGLKVLVANLQAKSGFTRIAIPSESLVKYVEISSILRCQAEGNYTTVFLRDGTKIISTRLLKEYEETLKGHAFFRIHRSHLINLKRVLEFRKQGHDIVVLEDGSPVEISRNRKADFLRAMGKV